MTEKVCNLYKEEQVGKTREGRKAVPTSKIPDLKWDIAETQPLKENQKKSNMTLTLQTIVTITIMITSVKTDNSIRGKIPMIDRKNNTSDKICDHSSQS